MFDLGFSQLVLIAVVLLVVVGPERLPRVARTVGHLFGRMQRYVSDVKADIQREIQIDELKKFQQEAQALEQSLYEGTGGIQTDLQEALSLPESESSKTVVPSQETDVGVHIGMQDEGAQESRPEPEDAPAPTEATPVKPADSA